MIGFPSAVGIHLLFIYHFNIVALFSILDVTHLT